MTDDTIKNRLLAPDPREAKLPAWARDRYLDLRREVAWLTEKNEELQARLDAATGVAGPEDSDTILDPDQDAPLRLRKGSVVRFLPHPNGTVDEGRFLDVCVDERGRVMVDSGTGRILVATQNMVCQIELRAQG